MRTAKPIVLDAVSRLEIERNARGRSIAARVVMRSRIILLAAKGLQNLEIAQQMKIAPRTVHRWRERFLDRGIVGLLKDAP
jgi:DNA-binding NarL/FixJ family response regulator